MITIQDSMKEYAHRNGTKSIKALVSMRIWDSSMEMGASWADLER